MPDYATTQALGAMKTLRLALLLAAWVAGLVLFVATTRPFPIVELAAAVLLAILAGVLWSRGSAVAIRASRAVFWVNAVGGLIWAMAFAPDMFAGAWLAGVFAFGLLFTLERAVLGNASRPNAMPTL